MKINFTTRIVWLSVILLAFHTKVFSQLTTVTFDAEILSEQSVRAEVGSILDNQLVTHIAWFKKTADGNNTLMYSTFSDGNLNTQEIISHAAPANVIAPSITLDLNNNPHIVYFLKRDRNGGTRSGNYAVMYAGDEDGDGVFSTNQVSTNPTNPTDDTYNAFNCYVQDRPSITLDVNGVISIYYGSDSEAETGYDHELIIAKLSNGSWTRTREFNDDDLGMFFDVTGGYVSPVQESTGPITSIITNGDYSVRYAIKSAGSWSSYIINDFNGTFANSNVQINVDNTGRNHLMWLNDNNDQFVNVTLEGSAIVSTEVFPIAGNWAGNVFGASIDKVTGAEYFFYGIAYSPDGYIVSKDESGQILETLIEDAGELEGSRNMHVRNNYISLVTASDANNKLIITTGTISNSSGNNPPAIQNQSFDLHAASGNGTEVGTVVAADPEGDSFSFALTSGNTNDVFFITNDGRLLVNNFDVLSTANAFNLEVTVTDSNGNATTATVTVNLFGGSSEPACSGGITFTDPSGVFEDGSSTFNYQNNLNCSWLISVAAENTVTLSFNSFAVETDRDFVRIYDGESIDAPLLLEATGRNLPSSVVSSSNKVLVTFTSDASFADSGWEISYTSEATVNQAPVMSDQTFSVNLSSANGTEVGTVEASDPEGDSLEYFIIAGNTDNTFSISKSTGTISLSNNNALDSAEIYLLTVEAFDSSANSVQATITINVVSDAVLSAKDISSTIQYAYPNPTAGKVFLKNVETSKLKLIQLVSLSGTTITMPLTEELDLSGISDGIYYLKMLTKENELLTYKIVKKEL